jgi:GLPGLI family protein
MNRFFLFLPIFLFLNKLKAQSPKADYTLYYHFTYITDTVEETYSDPEEYILYKYKSTSRFLNRNAYQNDSIRFVYNDKMGKPTAENAQEWLDLYMKTERKKIRKHISDLRLMKDFKKGSAIIILYNTNRRQYMEESLNLDWELQNGKKTIAGLTCSKATTKYGGREYTAWYTTEIPIPDGPYIFNGLPGLIVKVVDSKGWYDFELKSTILRPTQRYVDPDFLAGNFVEQINRSTYIARSKNEKENPKLMHGLPNPTPEMKLRLKERRKKRFDLLLEQ